MPKPRMLDAKRLEADYRSREHTLDELCKIHQCGKRVLVRNLRELGLSGSGVRPKGPRPAPPNPRILEDYREGQLYLRDIAKKHGVSYREVYRQVREAKVKPRIIVEQTCEACHERFRPVHKTDAHDHPNLCSSYCLMWARMHPEKGISVEPSRKVDKSHPRYRARRHASKRAAEKRGQILVRRIHTFMPADIEAWRRAFGEFGQTEIPWIPKWKGGEDNRGKARRVEGGTYWGAFADKPVLLRFEQTPETEVYFRVQKRADETSAQWVTRTLLGGHRDYAFAFDAVLAWRCECPTMTTVVIETLDDIPNEPGDYGLCPQCGAVAVEVQCVE